MSKIKLTNLPPEVQLAIFEECDVESLGRLQRTCRKFRSIIANEKALWKRKSHFVLYSNSYADEMKKRCKLALTPKQKITISSLWKKGKFEHTNTIFTYSETMPWIVQEKDSVMLSVGHEIRNFKRSANGNAGDLLALRHIVSREEITKFVINGNHIVTAYTDGKISFDAKETLVFCFAVRAHTDVVYCLDAKDNIIVSGSKDNFFKIWQVIDHHDIQCVKRINMKVKILSTAILHARNSVLLGLPGTQKVHPLQLYDIETAKCISKLGKTFSHGAGFLDIYPEDENTFLCGGYETTVQLWDVRTPDACVTKWTEPYDNSILCIRSDHNISILSGSSRNIVHFWDKRVPEKSVYMCLRTSPLLYTVLDLIIPIYILHIVPVYVSIPLLNDGSMKKCNIFEK